MNNTMSGPWAQGGAWIADQRAALEITQAELAEQADLPSAEWLADIEAGRRPVPSAFYQSLANEFGQSARDFALTCLRFYDPKTYEALTVETEVVLRHAA